MKKIVRDLLSNKQEKNLLKNVAFATIGIGTLAAVFLCKFGLVFVWATA